MKYKNIVWTVLVFLTAFLFLVSTAPAKDITARVIRETILDERIAQFCLNYCVGNMRQGRLTGVYINRIQGSLYHVVATARLRSCNDGLFAFDRTALVKAEGVLNRDTCELQVDKVEVQNDFQNMLTNLLNQHSDLIGSVRTIPNCWRFTD